VVRELTHDDDRGGLVAGFERAGVKCVALALGAERDDGVMNEIPVVV
jgi:hypothetical protein